MPEPLLTKPEVAKQLRTTIHTLSFWRTIGAGPVGMTVGRRILYRQSDIDSYLDRLAAESAAQQRAG